MHQVHPQSPGPISKHCPTGSPQGSTEPTLTSRKQTCRKGDAQAHGTYHSLWKSLQSGLELVGRGESVWEVHSPGEDEQ